MKTITATDVRAKLAALYSNAKRIEVVEHGYDNIVGLVDETYAVRFPRNNDAYSRSQYEKSVLESIHGVQTLEIPKILDEGSDSHYLVTSFLHGAHLSSDAIRHLSQDEQDKFARDIAQFAFTLHQSLSIDDVRNYRRTFVLDELDEPWDLYFEKHLSNPELPNEKQNQLITRYYQAWRNHVPSSGIVAVHDDLHTDNMLFQEGSVTGVLDFGDTNVGTPEQELRQLYRINERVLRVAIETYSALSDKELSYEFAKNWAIVQELGSYVDRSSTGSTGHPSYIRACNNLNNWLPQAEWGGNL